MRSQEVYYLMQSGKEIRVALETDGDRIGELHNEKFPMPVGEGEPAFDYRLFVQNLITQLDSAVDRAVEAEDEHDNSLIRVSRLRDERKLVVDECVDKLVATRQGLESLYSRGGFELINVSGDTPRVPERLHEQLGQSIKLLRSPAVDLRQNRVEGFNVDLSVVADDLESRRQELRGSIDRVDAGRKLAEGTLLVKREAIEELQRTILWVGRTAEGLFHLAGESGLAERIRSSTRRPPRPSEKTEAAAEQAVEGEESPAANGSASEPRASTQSSAS